MIRDLSVIYLDTHIVLWLHGGRRSKLSAVAIRALEREDDLRISPMVSLEIALLHETGICRDLPTQVIGSLAAAIRLRVCDMAWSEVVSCALPMSWTRDPFDRLITAHAAAAEAGLVTADATIHEHFPNAIW